MQQGGSAPRPVLENVGVADWAPDGQSLAVAHEVDGKVRLEYPIGTVLYESPGWISDIRVNPDGDRVLIADNPLRATTSLHRVVHRDGRVRTSASAGGGCGDLDGESVLRSNGGGVFRVAPGHDQVRILSTVVSMRLLDLAPSGRMLVAAAAVRRETFGRAPGMADEVNLSWQDWSTPALLSDDGRWVVFEEGNDGTREGYAIYLRRTDGAAPVQLGYGSTVALSPDQSWLAIVRWPTADQTLILVPTGPGPADRGPGGLRIANQGGRWLEGQDGGDVLVVPARGQDEALRIYRIPLDGSAAPQAITPGDFPLAAQGHVVSSDGRRLVVMPAEGAAVAFTGDGVGPQPLAGVLPTDLPLGLSRDGRHLFVQVARTIPSPIDRVDTVSGERTRQAELSPRDPAGVSIIDRVRFSEDGRGYVYSIRRVVSELKLVEGLR